MFHDIELISFPEPLKEVSEEARKIQRAIFLDEPIEEPENLVDTEAPF